MKVALFLIALFAVAAANESAAQFINDNNVLNYALTLENLEAAFYANGLKKFADSDFTAAGYPAGTRAFLEYISSQEAGHATVLSSVISGRGWPAVTPCTYNFDKTTTNVTTFLQYITIVEATGTQAYDGAAQALTNTGLLTIAAGIATVEARHTAAVNIVFNLTTNSSFPNAFEIPLDEGTVFDNVKSFFVSCTPATTFVKYLGASGQNYTAQSDQPATYTWQNASVLRGGVSGRENNLYYGNPAALTADLSILQYALVLENLEATFYAAFNASYTTTAIAADPNYNTFYTGNNASVVSLSIGAIAAHEATHAAFLNKSITDAGQTSAVPCTQYLWSKLPAIPNVPALPDQPDATNPTFSTFIQYATFIENVGVRAYVGAIAYITNSAAATQAATIATVEGRHAAFLASIRDKNPPTTSTDAFPSAAAGQPAADAPVQPQDTFNAIAPVLGNCANSKPSPQPFVGNTSQLFNFYSDKTAPSPFAAFPTTSSTTSSTTSPAAPSSTTTSSNSPVAPSTTTSGNRGTNGASHIAFSVGIIALAAVALL